MTTPEGPAATRCEICLLEKSPNLGGGIRTRENFCFREKRPRDTECWSRGYERVSARLVEVERAHLKFIDEHNFGAFEALRSRALAAEARLSEVEGALRLLREMRLPGNGNRAPRLLDEAIAALSGSPPISGEGGK